jgi:hypothetical protein
MSIYKTACGGTIVVPLKAEEHLRAHPQVLKILPEAIGRIRLSRYRGYLATEVNMERLVGRSGCVMAPWIGLDDKAFFAQRIGREKSSRVQLEIKGQETTQVAILAFEADESREEMRKFILITSWIGFLAPKEPWDPNVRSQEDFKECLNFWSSHALVYDPKVMGPYFESTWRKIISLGSPCGR